MSLCKGSVLPAPVFFERFWSVKLNSPDAHRKIKLMFYADIISYIMCSVLLTLHSYLKRSSQ